jgi:hypothetical protein
MDIENGGESVSEESISELSECVRVKQVLYVLTRGKT